jgi:lipopolysaccharide export system protein LptA
MRSGVLPFAIVFALASATAIAERADREKDIVVGADKALADDANKTSTFEGNVVVTQGTMRMTAAKVTVREDKDKFKYYVASGSPVTFRQKRDNVDEWVEGYADRAEFDDRNDVVKLFNKAKVKSSKNEVTGDFISYDMRREVAEVTGASTGSRVKMVITPEKKAEPGKDAAPKEGLRLKPDTGTTK